MEPGEQMLGEDLRDSLRPGAINLTVMSERQGGGQAQCRDNSPRQTLSVKSDTHNNAEGKCNTKQMFAHSANRGLMGRQMSAPFADYGRFCPPAVFINQI